MRQEDLFFSQLTVRETLSFAAELQLPEISSAEERDEYVNNLLLKLGLVRFLIHLCILGKLKSWNLFLDYSLFLSKRSAVQIHVLAMQKFVASAVEKRSGCHLRVS